MKRLLLILLLAAFVGGTVAPTLSRLLLGFGPAIAFAGNNDDQGDDDDDQGEEEQV